MASLPRLAIRRPVATAMFFLAVALVGLLSFSRLPVDLLPDVAYPRLVVYTGVPGAAPAEVERFVSEPVEQALSTVPGVQQIESSSREGASLVSARFAWGTDMDFAALNARERLDGLRGALPERASRPAVLRTDPRSEPVLALALTGELDAAALTGFADAVLKRRLEQIDGVALAAVTGGTEREIHVEVDVARLEAHGLTLEDVSAALEAANVSAPGGTVLRGRYRYPLRTLGEFQAVAEIGELPLVSARPPPAGSGDASGAAGAPGATGEVLLRDVARVEDGVRERESLTRHDGREAVGVLVFKNADANTVRVAEAVDAVLAELRREYPRLGFAVASSQAGFIAAALANVAQEVALGGLLAFLVLFLFLRDLRYPVAVALAIPLSLLATFAALHAAGVSLNLLSLGGLALGVGMLMDNSIVVLENIVRHRERGLGAAAAAALGAKEVQRAITASTLTTIAVFGPIVYLEGVAGELLQALALSVAFSLLASIVVAVTLLPMLAARWGPHPPTPSPAGGRGGKREEAENEFPLSQVWERGPGGEGAVAVPPNPGSRAPGPGPNDEGLQPTDSRQPTADSRFLQAYERLLTAALRHRARTLGLAAALLLAGVALALTLPRSVLPEVDQGGFRLRLELPPGTPLEQTAAAAARLEAILLADAAVADVFTQAGRRGGLGAVEDRERGLQSASLDVHLADGASTAAVLRRLGLRLQAATSAALAVETGQATALGRLLDLGEADLAVRLRGDDLDALLAYGRQAETQLARVPELANVRLGTTLGQPEVRVEIERERAASYGIDPARVAAAVEAFMHGTLATEFVDFDRKVPVVVRLPVAERQSLQTLERLRVDGVPLRELVTLRSASGPVAIHRLGQARVVTVHADVASGASLDEAVRAARAELARLPAPGGVRAEVGGENEEMRRGFRALALAFALALALVYMLLAAEFESLLHPFIVLLAVPLSVVGAVLALWLAGAGLNTMSLIGLVVLVGIVDNDAVVKVDFINRMRCAGMPRREALFAAGRARLRPIVMNTLTAMLGLLPLALGLGAGAELQAPMALAVFGGLLSATALTLVVIPVAYDVLEELKERLAARRERRPRGAVGSAPEAAAVEQAEEGAWR